MEISINALVERVDEFLYERGSLLFRFSAGLAQELPLSKVHQGFPELSRLETFQRVREMLASPRTDGARKVGLKLLLHFLGDNLEEVKSAPSHEIIAQLLATAPVNAGSGTLPLGEALARLPDEPNRDRRELLERESSQLLWERRSAWARRIEAALELAHELKAPSYRALREELTGVPLEPLLTGSEEVLKTTGDAWRDLLGYAVKRLDPNLEGRAQFHDAKRAAQAPWMMELFRKDDLFPAVTRWLSELGLDPNAEGRLSFDAEDRPGKRTGAFVAELRVPDELRLVAQPRSGFEGFAEVLRAFGRGQHHANASRTTPLLERRLGDPAVPRAVAALFENVMLDEQWHKRYLRVPQAQAREAARLFAFRQTMRFRRKAALLPYALELYARGPSDAMAEEYQARMQATLGVAVPKERFLYDVRPMLLMVSVLRGWALEAVMFKTLRERFNEDFWRNPAAGRWLKELSQRGQRDDAAEIARQLGGELDLKATGARLVRVMGA
ncbi:MAG: peptidase M3 [Myxococcaceae bacterium]|nr:peptidase M3 [Myxococcaceae bacterium]